MIRHALHSARQFTLPLLPGLLISLTIVFAAHYISTRYGSPLILTTVLLGMAFNNLARNPEFTPGLEYSAKIILRYGVALLGVRITFDHISHYGYQPLVLVFICVVTTIGFSLLVGKWLGADRFMTLLTGIATAICGVSAAMAFLALQPARQARDNQIACTLVAVTCISTLSMILYPALLSHFDLSAETMGMFLGTTIHDVAQAIGAGEMISPAVADAAIYTKMLRVSLLVPVLIVVGLFAGRRDHAGTANSVSILQRFPLFLIVFLLIMLLNNTITIPPLLQQSMNSLSQYCLLMAMAALGIRTNIMDLFAIEKRPLALVFLNTLCIALVSIIVLSF